jgi:hypothetical protein
MKLSEAQAIKSEIETQVHYLNGLLSAAAKMGLNVEIEQHDFAMVGCKKHQKLMSKITADIDKLEF